MRALAPLLATAFALASAAPALTADDVLAPARAGKAQCYQPNPERKLCDSMGWYEWRADGSIANRTEVLLPGEGAVVVMHSVDTVTVRDRAVCSPILAATIAASTFTVNGREADAADTARYRSAISRSMQPLFGVEACVIFTPEGEGLRADATINGKAEAALTQRVMWVAPADGWRVGR